MSLINNERETSSIKICFFFSFGLVAFVGLVDLVVGVSLLNQFDGFAVVSFAKSDRVAIDLKRKKKIQSTKN